MTAPPVDKDQGMPRIEIAPAAPVRPRFGGRYWIGLLWHLAASALLRHRLLRRQCR
jgi:hypothetical protein